MRNYEDNNYPVRNQAYYIGASMGAEVHDYFDSVSPPNRKSTFLVVEALEDSVISYRVTGSDKKSITHENITHNDGKFIYGTIDRLVIVSGSVRAYYAPDQL